MRIRCRAPAKVNLVLAVGPRRADGRHRLVTIFQALSLCDEVELVTLAQGPDRVRCPGVRGENLAARALAALRERGWDGPPVGIDIVKRIPIAAGLAGGSADAAAVLRLASKLLPGRPEELEEVAALLGADVPSQLAPGLSIGTGAGERIDRYPPLGPHSFVVVPAPVGLGAGEVYQEADRLGRLRGEEELAALERRLQAVLAQGGSALGADLIANDLEPAALSLLPQLGSTLTAVRGAGAAQAIVSGSGPTVVGVWWGPDAPRRSREAAAALVRRFPGTLAADPVDADWAMPQLE
jgi:4-diphosphocytidyl-2-C-methyl-D-erythritol kinase